MDLNVDFEAVLATVRKEEAKKSYKVLCPEEYKKGYLGDLYGYFVEKTGIFNIFIKEYISSDKIAKVGVIATRKRKKGLCGVATKKGLNFYYNGEIIASEFYALHADIYSRNGGIVESSVMRNQCAIIAGVGSGGSFIALELAKSGVEHFVLVDDDIFSYHNISRHQCGVYDVGKRKVDAVKERILAINPSAQVNAEFKQIQDIDVSRLNGILNGKKGIILSCGDNRIVDHYCNSLSEKLNVPLIAAGATARAVEGEIFWYIPRHNMPCYACAFGEDVDITRDNRVSRVWYATEEELKKMDFTPGMAADIDYISIIVVKLAIDLLMIGQKVGNEIYRPKLLGQISQYIRICNHLSDMPNDIFGFQRSLEIKNGKVIKAKKCYLCDLIAKYSDYHSN